VLGPAPAPIERIKQRYRWQIAIKSQDLKLMRAALATMRQQIAQSAEHAKVRVVIDIDPINMM
jgi:primosomal protein N' (replication factor Y)